MEGIGEEGIFEVGTMNYLLVPHNSKTILVQNLQSITKKIGMYCINYHMTNHNVETCRVKRKEESILVVSKLITQ